MATNTLDYISKFIQSHSLPATVAKGVLHTQSDCDDFYIGYHGKNRFAIDDLLDYKENRIENSNITLDIFLDMCNNVGIGETFKKVFFQFFEIVEVALIKDAIDTGRVSLEEIFEGFQKNPNRNILKTVI